MADRIKLVDHEHTASAFLEEVLDGLTRDQKELPCKLLYDEEGSRLYERITRLPEYYPTRVEARILRDNIDSIATAVGGQTLLIEYGSGNSEKTRILLDNLTELAGYIPIDISREHLAAAAREIATEYPDLEVLPVCGDYNSDLDLPDPTGEVDHRLVFFPGSTIGNFHPDEAVDFMAHIATVVGRGGGLLIGVDVRKDPRILKRAYNDAHGVTARFNLNLLRHLNRELNTDFDMDAFRHEAVWNEEKSRVEMHLVSEKSQSVEVNGKRIDFDRDESIWTESSYKYELEHFADLARRAGFRVADVWQDEEELFSVQRLVS